MPSNEDHCPSPARARQLVSAQPDSAGHAAVDERAMKVAYLYHFTLFAQWPSLPVAGFQLCVLGRTALDEELDQLNGKRAQNGLHITVRWIMPNALPINCQVLFIDEHNRHTFDSLFQQLAAMPVLTITDASGFTVRES